MDDGIGRLPLPGIALAGVDDRDRAAVGAPQRARVAGLATAGRIEHGPVALDRAVVNGDDDGGGLAPVGVVAEQRFGSHEEEAKSEEAARSVAGRRATYA